MDGELRIAIRDQELLEVRTKLEQIHKALVGAEKPISMEEAEAFLGSSRKHIYNMIRKGMPCHKEGKLYFYKSEINNWLKNK